MKALSMFSLAIATLWGSSLFAQDQDRDQIQQQLQNCDGVASTDCDELRERERLREREQEKSQDQTEGSSGSSGGSGGSSSGSSGGSGKN